MSFKCRDLTQRIFKSKVETHLSAGNGHLNLATGSSDDLAKLLSDALQEAQSVVLGEGVEEVLEGGAAGTGLLDELGNNRRLVGGGQGGSGQDSAQLGVLVEDAAQLGELFGGGIEGGSLGGRGVLKIDASISHRFVVMPIPPRPEPQRSGKLRNWQLLSSGISIKTIFPSGKGIPEQWRRCHRDRRRQWEPWARWRRRQQRSGPEQR